MEVAPPPVVSQTFPTLRSPPVAITDLLDRIPFSPRERPAPTVPERTFEVEVPEVERVGIALPEGVVPAPPPEPPAPPAPPPAAPRPPLPSYAVALIGGLTLLSLALAAALAVAASDGTAEAARPAEAPAGPAAPRPPDADRQRVVADAAYTADPAPIPVDLITRLEEASEEPLDVELSRLLDAIQHGFGRRSVQLEPTLRSYVYRMSSRFEWNPDTFRVAVTAPDADLATARAATLERLFDEAVAAGRLDVGTGVGPHALSLVSE